MADMQQAPRLLSVEEILNAQDLAEEIVEVPEWGGAVKVKAFTKARQQELREAARVAGEIDGNRLEMQMFIYGVVEPRFAADQYELVRAKCALALDRVLRVISRLNNLNPEAIDAAKAAFPA